MNFKKFFQKSKKVELEGIEKALGLNLITKEEFLRLKQKRITEELEDFLKEKKLKK